MLWRLLLQVPWYIYFLESRLVPGARPPLALTQLFASVHTSRRISSKGLNLSTVGDARGFACSKRITIIVVCFAAAAEAPVTSFRALARPME